MAFRNDNDALRAKVRSLEAKVEELEEELEGRDGVEADAKAETAAEREAEEEDHAEVEDLAGRVAARERRERERELVARSAARVEDERRAAKLARRAQRVAVIDELSRCRITIGPKPLSDRLFEQLGWGFGFIFINPGIFIVIGLTVWLVNAADVPFGKAVTLTVGLWAVVLGLCNVAYARLRQRRYVLDISADGHFALAINGRREPAILGRLEELEPRIDDPDPAKLGRARLSDGRTTVEIENLTARDLTELRAALDRQGVPLG